MQDTISLNQDDYLFRYQDTHQQTSHPIEGGQQHQRQDCTQIRLSCEDLGKWKSWEKWGSPSFEEIVSCTEFYPVVTKKPSPKFASH